VVADGAIHRGRSEHMNPSKQWLADNTNSDGFAGPLSEAVKGADVFIGVSAADVLTVDDVKGMASARRDTTPIARKNPSLERVCP